MPHQCTQCGHTFPDGSKEMLSGCPDCGGNKFQFRPTTDKHDTETSQPSADVPSTPESPTEPETTDKDFHKNRTRAAERDSESEAPAAGANTDDSDSGPPESARAETASNPPSSESGESADMAALRQELDDQFESIKILEPGQYELNLMELYNREEYIIALQEDGQYVIEVPETWLGDDS